MSHYDTPFIFSNIGFLFISSTRPVLSEADNDQSLLRARFHKHRLSFFYKNELKRVFLKKPGLLRLISSFKEDDSLTNREFFIPTRWSVSSESPSHLSTSIASQFFHTSIEKERYLTQFEVDLDAGEIEPDLALKRIRFKPGYQRI
jgi:phage terminase large subunit GpA-like protein